MPAATVMEDHEQTDSPLSPVANPAFGMPSPAAPCPPKRPEDIHRIVETVDRYNPQNIPVLETYVEDMLQNDAYDRDACLAVLKLYQFNPTYSNTAIVCNILALALCALPDPDFNLCLYMLNEGVLNEPDVDALVQLHRLLEQAKFVEFWTYLNGGESPAKELVAPYEHFEKRIRDYVSVTLGIAYQVIDKASLGRSLNLQGAALDKWIAEKGWTADANGDAKLVAFPITAENQVRPAVLQESIKFEHLTKIIGYGRLNQ
ncbi:armadillo-type protein [Fimicolochytrium jonesii]|uniref:armadillo-type protein n=1 Tax=Fimicolochytrium jonesii TaxID=1396493 RepID=UPI0022FEF26B|nr:armadillo-type protein [Fimicolochytrium jonesii]KAI8820707.1 armadillo-type protein [Fimicolochytrium jonesii]